MFRLWPPDADSQAEIDDLSAMYSPRNPTLPTFRVNFVSSLDGAVAVDGRSRALSSPADQRVLRLLRTQCDVLVVGAGTVRAEGYGPLRVTDESASLRTSRGRPGHPVLAVVSRSLDLDPEQPLFVDAPVRPIVITTSTAPADRRARLERVADVLICGEHSVEAAIVIEALVNRGLPQMLCEGGPQLFGTFLAAELVDELCLTVSPVLAGAGSGRIAAGPASPLLRFELAHALTENDTLLLRYVRPRRT